MKAYAKYEKYETGIDLTLICKDFLNFKQSTKKKKLQLDTALNQPRVIRISTYQIKGNKKIWKMVEEMIVSPQTKTYQFIKFHQNDSVGGIQEGSTDGQAWIDSKSDWEPIGERNSIKISQKVRSVGGFQER